MSLIEPINVFLDSGLQKTFIPLRKPANILRDPPDATKSLVDAMAKIESIDEMLPDKVKELLDETVFSQATKSSWKDVKPYLRYRFGSKSWYLKSSGPCELNGIWVLIETNTSAQDSNQGAQKFDRGTFYSSRQINETEREEILACDKEGKSFRGPDTPYVKLHEDQIEQFIPEIFDPDSGESLVFNELEITIGYKKPGGEVMDVDLMLDLGNTRIAGLLYNHLNNQVFNPTEFKQKFKVLRLKPDETSGNFDALDDVQAGIVPSWFVLHQPAHQQYYEPATPKAPELLSQEFEYHVAPHPSSLQRWFGKKEIVGKVLNHIPQMFSQLSPVVLGDQAERFFNLPYASNLIKVGANLQQSSPKRYYWDDTKSSVFWNMLLNDWDPRYDESPENDTSLPDLQGEMLRYMREDGKPLDFSQKLEPANQPLPNPSKPAYPKQCTLTWVLLRILEQAYSQVNSAFIMGANFIPHRLKKVLITYPAGWTEDEVELYRARCQEALNIFTVTNVYHGLDSEHRVEMVAQAQSPDEAIAGQLPFVFSEITRYDGQTAKQWIELVGKKRDAGYSARIMNFDIGGGTTDLSIVEYQDLNQDEKVYGNLLSTNLLFKDSNSIAGDTIQEKIIEKVVLGSLMRSRKDVPSLVENIQRKFTVVFTNTVEQSIRTRVIRTCLIPLAIYCMENCGNDSNSFSALDAGIPQNNWSEFVQFLEVDEEALAREGKFFSFSAKDINDIIREELRPLFRYCAIYAAAYNIDMLIFSGKPSEMSFIRTLAEQYIPIHNERIIFAKDFKPGDWYPFTDTQGYIQDAKTVTVVGAALYYALSSGNIAGWSIRSQLKEPERNEWGDLKILRQKNGKAFLEKDDDECQVSLLPNTIIARRQNSCSSPEPVYKFVKLDGEKSGGAVSLVSVTLSRNRRETGESLQLQDVEGYTSKEEWSKHYALKLWPCEDAQGISFWQDKGQFSNLQIEDEQ